MAATQNMDFSSMPDSEQASHIIHSAQDAKSKLGFAFESGSEALNEKNNVMSNINDYLIKLSESKTPQEMEVIKGVFDKANDFVNTDIYKSIDKYAENIIDLVDGKAVVLADTGGLSDVEVKILEENLQAYNFIIGAMNGDADFSFSTHEGSSTNHDEKNMFVKEGIYMQSDTSHMANANIEDNDSVLMGLNYALGYGTELSEDSINDLISGGRQLIYDAYGLDAHDIDLLLSAELTHEIGHASLNFDKHKSLDSHEFSAEMISLWSGVNNGGSEGFYDLKTENYSAAFGMDRTDDKHASIGMASTFLTENGYEYLQSISLEGLQEDIEAFIDNLPYKGNVAGYVNANQDLLESGIMPTLMKHLEKSGQASEGSELYEQLVMANAGYVDGDGYEYRINEVIANSDTDKNNVSKVIEQLSQFMHEGEGELGNPNAIKGYDKIVNHLNSFDRDSVRQAHLQEKMEKSFQYDDELVMN